MFVCKFLLLICAAGVLSQALPIYVNQASRASDQDGSKDKPFSSLAQAFAVSGSQLDIVLLGNSYTVAKKETFKTSKKDPISITVKALEQFTLNFDKNGQLSCYSYQQPINEPLVKNVHISFTGFKIETKTSLPLFYGDCYFTLQDVLINEITSPLIVMKSKGGVLLKDLTINNINLSSDQNLIDQESRERLEADYLILDGVVMKNSKANADGTAMIRSFLQYQSIEVKNSILDGVGFSIKGEQIGGNLKTDIKVQKVTMTNAMNFFSIESYGNILVEDSVFKNSANGAFSFLLGDENLSPIGVEFKNCLFQDNTANFAGAALLFQSSYETSYQFTLNVRISSSIFIRNKASFSGGALAFLFFKSTDILVTDCEFDSNSGTEAGGAVYVNKGDQGMKLAFKNSVFNANSAFAGGVFSFEFLNGAQITLENNHYTNNQAELEGGVGYVTESLVNLKDTNSLASGNKADFQGGVWCFESQSDITFDGVQFKKNQAFVKGGCIANLGASLNIYNANFENCELKATSSLGGAVFIGEDATIHAVHSKFTNNLAENGASIAIQSLKTDSQIIEGCTLAGDLQDANSAVKNQIYLTSGNLVLENIVITKLKTPFFNQVGGHTQIKKVTVGSIECNSDEDSFSYCLVGIESTSNNNGFDLELEDLNAETVISNVPVFSFQGASVSIVDLDINELRLPRTVPVTEVKNSAWSGTHIRLPCSNSKFVRSISGSLNLTYSNFVLKEKQGGPNQLNTKEFNLDFHDCMSSSEWTDEEAC